MMDIIEKIKELSEEFKPDVIKFAQKLIKTPSISGNEKELSDLLLEEMKNLDITIILEMIWEM